MLLLYPVRVLWFVMLSFIYIPLCFYFIAGQSSTGSWIRCIYIPLCFYFILRPHPRTAGSIPYLHSTMLLLYLGRKTCVSCIASNLHSTMLLLYQYAIMSTVALLLYLHSTMLLLYRVHGSQSRSWLIIYIPLCFYFITCHLLHPVQSFQFTFHYASTLSHHRPSMNDFVHTHLHSTMLLLYPLFFMTAYYTGEIYIPLCFYFIESLRDVAAYPVQIYIPLCFYFIVDNPEDKRRNYNGFTFHYASTLSRIWSKRTGKSFIYIPLCFYFIAVLHN